MEHLQRQERETGVWFPALPVSKRHDRSPRAHRRPRGHCGPNGGPFEGGGACVTVDIAAVSFIDSGALRQ
jgi:hypothetical protein